MIGVILSGHGHFGQGLLSAISAIAGPQENVKAIDFYTGGGEDLQVKILQTICELHCDSIAIFTDIAGGTPFNQSVLAARQASCSCRVFSGSNLPLLLGFLLERHLHTLDELTASLLGSDQIKVNVYTERSRTTGFDPEEGLGI